MDSPDATAFAVIYDREFAYVWRALRRMGIPTRDLPDLTHDVFLTAFRSLGRYDPTRPMRPWLFGVVFRVASDHIHLARNKRELLLEGEQPDLADARPGPHEAHASREEWAMVDDALRSLTVPQRAVLVMHDFLGHKGHEVADALNVPLQTVFSRLRVARVRFMDAAASAKNAGRRQS